MNTIKHQHFIHRERIKDYYTLKIEFTSNNIAIVNFKTEAERENYISMLFLTSGKIIKGIEKIII
jgi:hypothetical protein